MEGGRSRGVLSEARDLERRGSIRREKGKRKESEGEGERRLGSGRWCTIYRRWTKRVAPEIKGRLQSRLNMFV